MKEERFDVVEPMAVDRFDAEAAAIYEAVYRSLSPVDFGSAMARHVLVLAVATAIRNAESRTLARVVAALRAVPAGGLVFACTRDELVRVVEGMGRRRWKMDERTELTAAVDEARDRSTEVDRLRALLAEAEKRLLAASLNVVRRLNAMGVAGIAAVEVGRVAGKDLGGADDECG